MASVLGLSGYYHDSAACILVDGRIVAAAQEERFSRRKNDAAFPSAAVRYCLDEAGLEIDDVDAIGFYEKPLVKFDRLLESYLASAPRGLRSYMLAMPQWLGQKLWLADDIQEQLETERQILFGNHHESHAASAFYPSPYEEAAILTIDGVGEWATASIGHGEGAEISLISEMPFPHSLGLLYSAFTYFTGFEVNGGEYKVMGLAPYGSPRYVDAIRNHIVEIFDDGSIRLNLDQFEFVHGLTMTGTGFEKLFGGPRRSPSAPVTRREMDLARSIQEVTEEIVYRMARTAAAETGSRKLTMAGGVALNCVANGKLLRSGLFDDIWVQPAAGDAGGALGVAYAIWHRYLGNERLTAEQRGLWRLPTEADPLPPFSDAMQGAMLGPEFGDEEVAAWFREKGIEAEHVDSEDLPDRIAELIEEGMVVGVARGRMEFGPRALGCRSILADARSPAMQSQLNHKIKFRESFRPFAPAVMREHVSAWFDLERDSPYMLLVTDVAVDQLLELSADDAAAEGLDALKIPRSTIPAVTHVDGSARVQTVRQESNPFFYEILAAFNRRTGCPVIVNTSFNVKDEPIVCTHQDAYNCFLNTEMDAVVIGSYLLTKAGIGDGMRSVSAAPGSGRTSPSGV